MLEYMLLLQSQTVEIYINRCMALEWDRNIR